MEVDSAYCEQTEKVGLAARRLDETRLRPNTSGPTAPTTATSAPRPRRAQARFAATPLTQMLAPSATTLLPVYGSRAMRKIVITDRSPTTSTLTSDASVSPRS